MCEFQVIDEGAGWIVVSKSAPLAVHPANGRFDEPTLLGGVEALLACELSGGNHLSILTRLDRETSGLVLIAKNPAVARYFSKQLESRTVKKTYTAMVHGWPNWETKLINQPIIRAGELAVGPIWLRQVVHSSGRESVTRFKVARRFTNVYGKFTEVQCFPKTGRMHQLRVHLEALGHPIVGDKIYGTDGTPYLERIGAGLSVATRAKLLLPRQALHARQLEVEFEGAKLSWTSKLPMDLVRFTQVDWIIPSDGECF